MTPTRKQFNAHKLCCFCGANNEAGVPGYAGERVCPVCGRGGLGEPDEPVMAYKQIADLLSRIPEDK